jgi:hypothetical protein
MNSLGKAERDALEFIEFCSLTSYHEARASAGMLDIAPEPLRIVGAHELLWAGMLLRQTPKGRSQEFTCHPCSDGCRGLTQKCNSSIVVPWTYHHWQNSNFGASALLRRYTRLHPIFTSLDFATIIFLTEQGCQLCVQPPTWRTGSLYLCPQ